MTHLTTRTHRMPAPRYGFSTAAVTLRALEELADGPGLSAEQVALMILCKEQLGLPIAYSTYTKDVLNVLSQMKAGA
ncbi:hypothetical protein [Deinococcus cellulosilyticus]|uniref:Uncharacterized protein n=1 Tax=Deinococcus cellulosilyticus (strain DSM 18568 / NBRC 106333 / KACC 11606 / 5516J-15) TaxID=1223518 RepID=A0A511N2U9_DEIC1|nr:hypothetical protein [Deinococcus cellulosilyticus]GEM47180.1 hypothetical protein DC3_28150 [Deinococcus cellulosilyticus NBRC 106333 = KACC 11606]